MKYKKLTNPEKWLIVGIPILFIIGSAMHFIYDFSMELKLVGMFAPVNESLWEHLKMLLLPVIGWWSVYYAVKGTKYNINKDKWFYGAVISLIFSMITVLAFYYTYTGAFGIHSLALDIFDLFLGIVIGQYLGLHIYKYSKGCNFYISIFILLLITIIFVTFTFNPPHIPLFKDGPSGGYGI